MLYLTKEVDYGVLQMKKYKLSLVFCIIITVFFSLFILALMLIAPKIVNWFTFYSVNADTSDYIFFLITIYAGGAAALVMLVSLISLLKNIYQEQVFIRNNIKLLKIISISCFVGSIIALSSAFYYPAWGVIGIGGFFMALIIWVVKNVIAKAVIIKEEQDLTI